jgi:hypothetical protein
MFAFDPDLLPRLARVAAPTDAVKLHAGLATDMLGLAGRVFEIFGESQRDALKGLQRIREADPEAREAVAKSVTAEIAALGAVRSGAASEALRAAGASMAARLAANFA